MASFHFSAKPISRGKGYSAVAAAAYRARVSLYDERTGETHDYSRMKNRAVFAGLFVPKDAPGWAHDREQLWNQAERAETEFNRKKNAARVAQDITIALPHEMTDQQREWLLKDFVREQFQRKGYVVDVAIHEPHEHGDKRNYHAHLLISERVLSRDGFAREKDRALQDKATLKHWREDFANRTNRHLERHGIEARVDHRSLKAQGIDREPGIHLGKDASAAERKGHRTERGERAEAIKTRNDERQQIREDIKAIEQEQQRYDRPTEAVAAEIFDTRFMSDCGAAFAAALAEHGLSLAQVTPDEQEALNQQRPRHWRPLEAGEYAVVNEQGRLYELTEHNTGLTQTDRQNFLKDLDGTRESVTETRMHLFTRQHDGLEMPRGKEVLRDAGDMADMAAGFAGNILGSVVNTLEPLLGSIADYFTGSSARTPSPRAPHRQPESEPHPQRMAAAEQPPRANDRMRQATPEVAARDPDVQQRARSGDQYNMPQSVQDAIRRRVEENRARQRERENDQDRTREPDRDRDRTRGRER